MKKLNPRYRNVFEVTLFLLALLGFITFQSQLDPLVLLAAFIPILAVSILVVLNADHIVDGLIWVIRNPQKGLARVFLFMAVIALIRLSISPEPDFPHQNTIAFLAIGLNLFFGFFSSALLASMESQKSKPKPKPKPKPWAGALLILALLLTTALTVAAVAKG